MPKAKPVSISPLLNFDEAMRRAIQVPPPSGKKAKDKAEAPKGGRTSRRAKKH